MTTRLGVVIPVFNGTRYIDQALASVASQTRRADKVVVVDDGSVDGSGDAARRWCDLLPLEVITHDRNAGLGQARRTAIAALDTDTIALLDVDDVWLPDHLACMLNVHDAFDGLVTARALRWVPGEALATTPIGGYSLPPRSQQLARLIVMNYVFVGSLFSRELYEIAGAFRPWNPPGAEDWDLWLRMVAGGAAVSTPSVPTVLYRVHDTSMSADDGSLAAEIAVLRSFGEDAPAGVRADVARSLRHRRARLQLRDAYQAARDGSVSRARTAALRAAIYGPRGVRVRAIASVAAPRAVVRRRDALRAKPRHLVKP
jgi:hypothetical protein